MAGAAPAAIVSRFSSAKTKLGPIIGQRTWGGLIGMTGAPRLIDGGNVTVPTFSIYDTQGQVDHRRLRRRSRHRRARRSRRAGAGPRSAARARHRRSAEIAPGAIRRNRPKNPPTPSAPPNEPASSSRTRRRADTGDLTAVLAAALTHFGCQAGTVHLLRDGVLKLVAHKNIPPPVVQIVETVPIGKGIAGLAARAPRADHDLQFADRYEWPGASRREGDRHGRFTGRADAGRWRIARRSRHRQSRAPTTGPPEESALLTAVAAVLAERL